MKCIAALCLLVLVPFTWSRIIDDYLQDQDDVTVETATKLATSEAPLFYQEQLEVMNNTRLTVSELKSLFPRILNVSKTYSFMVIPTILLRAIRNIKNKELYRWYHVEHVELLTASDGITQLIFTQNGTDQTVYSDLFGIGTELLSTLTTAFLPRRIKSKIWPLQRVDVEAAEKFIDTFYPQTRQVLKSHLIQREANGISKDSYDDLKSVEIEMDTIAITLFKSILSSVVTSICDNAMKKTELSWQFCLI